MVDMPNTSLLVSAIPHSHELGRDWVGPLFPRHREAVIIYPESDEGAPGGKGDWTHAWNLRYAIKPRRLNRRVGSDIRANVCNGVTFHGL